MPTPYQLLRSTTARDSDSGFIAAEHVLSLNPDLAETPAVEARILSQEKRHEGAPNGPLRRRERDNIDQRPNLAGELFFPPLLTSWTVGVLINAISIQICWRYSLIPFSLSGVDCSVAEKGSLNCRLL